MWESLVNYKHINLLVIQIIFKISSPLGDP